MNRFVVAEEIEKIFSRETRVPSAVMWNRLEGRPRRSDFTRALKAEVRDALWMITRQWQMGEFIGEDAGSPVTAKVAWKMDSVKAVHSPAGEVEPYDQNLPLETVIEARPIQLNRAGHIHNVDLRLALGRRWKQLLEANSNLRGNVKDFQDKYPFVAPDPNAEADFPVTAHPGAWQTLAAVAGRAIDGGALWLHLAGGGAASDGLGLGSDPKKSDIDKLGQEFLAWATRLYFQPKKKMETWQPRHLEYDAGLSAPNGETPAALKASEYHGGRLDWYNFDAVPAGANDKPGMHELPHVTSFIPATVQFDGMPNTRHWAFEEGTTNFGAITPDTTDIAKLLLIEFGLLFANDWFLLPIDLPIGSLTSIKGLAVTNVFDERLWIEPSVTTGGPLQSWRMFRLTSKGVNDDRLFLPATTPAGQESSPVESVAGVRDEVSNMVWGIETMVQLADGSSRPGRELALELHAKFQSAVGTPAPQPSTNDAKIKYTLINSVPENWIPFIPVRIEGNNREIQLQRAAMPRLLQGQEDVIPQKVRPRTQVLREGLDPGPGVPYFVAEEEIERAGTVIETRWQRCRWKNGRVVIWLANQRKPGRGEISSGLAFDIVMPKSTGTG